MLIKKDIADAVLVEKKHIGVKSKLVILYQENIILQDGMRQM